jgi:hypothetical protein
MEYDCFPKTLKFEMIISKGNEQTSTSTGERGLARRLRPDQEEDHDQCQYEGEGEQGCEDQEYPSEGRVPRGLGKGSRQSVKGKGGD